MLTQALLCLVVGFVAGHYHYELTKSMIRYYTKPMSHKITQTTNEDDFNMV